MDEKERRIEDCRIEEDEGSVSVVLVNNPLTYGELSAGWEDMLYESWRDDQMERARNEKQNNREVAV